MKASFRRPKFLNPAIDQWLSGFLAVVMTCGAANMATFVGIVISLLPAPSAQAARLGTSTVSAGSVPPPAATTVDSFQPDLFTVWASTGIPLAVPPGRKGVRPSLALGYSSSSRNGWVGVGWNLDLGYIERSTRKGVPEYDASDTFASLFQGVNSELVRIGDGTFRAKDEGAFMKFENLGVPVGGCGTSRAPNTSVARWVPRGLPMGPTFFAGTSIRSWM